MQPRRTAPPARARAPRRTSSVVLPEILHDAVPGRVRFRHAAILGRPALAEHVVRGVLGVRGALTAKASPVTGSILITFAPPATAARLADAIAEAASGRSPPASAAGPAASPAASAASPAAGAASPASRPTHPRAAQIEPAVADAHRTPPSLTAGPHWHATSIADAVEQLGTHAKRGLAAAEAAARLARHGPNELPRTEPRSAVEIFREQLTNLPVALLGASAAISLLTGGIADAVVISGVVLANAGIATTTERQAERTILGLSNYAPHPVGVIRDGRSRDLAPGELVPGDLIELEPGTLVAADARLIEADDLTVNESALTGEALPVHKDAAARLRVDTALGDRATMVFRGTAVTGGRGLAVIVATGPATEIGRIHGLLGSVRPPETPIQRQLGEIEKELVIVNGAICAGVFALGLMRGHGVLPMLRTAISLAVAAIPEGLPAVATTTLALGVQDMRRRDVLVRTLEAVETLGAVEVVGLDKTGTLTENRMAAVAVHADGAMLALDRTHLTLDGKPVAVARRKIAARMFEIASLCSDAALNGNGIDGSATEAALVQAALDLGVDVAALRRAYPVATTVPRTLGRKRMSTVHAAGGRKLLCVKGDPVEVLERCTHVLTDGGPVALDAAARDAIQKANHRMAGKALRVLGMATRENGGDPRDERDLVWLGLAGLANPIRPSAVPAMKVLHGAGVRTVMITGDQSATALAIARELDLGDKGEIRVLEAGQIRGVDPEVLAAIAANPHVFARVSPVDKLEIVRALQANGRIVAMPGDGINDGPALKAADVGIAMGAGGTDVAREVADIVLATDELQGVIEAVRLGRATYANIRKVLRFLVSTNAAETMMMLGASVAGWPEPLSPMQLLWLNLVTDVAPGLALGLEPPEPDVLDEPPHDPRAPILSRADFRRVLIEGSILGGAALAAFLLKGGAGGPHATGAAPLPTAASTVAFHGVTTAQLVHAIACRSEHHGLLEELRRPPNRKLYAALAGCLGLQLTAQALPVMRRLLGLTPLAPADLVAIGAVAAGATAANALAGAALRKSARPA